MSAHPLTHERTSTCSPSRRITHGLHKLNVSQEMLDIRSRPHPGPRALSPLDRTPSLSPSRSKLPSRERSQRSSFSSIHEDDSGIAQSFIDAHSSSAVHICDEGDITFGESIDQETAAMLAVQSPAPAHAFGCTCGHYNGWKQVRLRGRGLSRSSSDLRLLASKQPDQTWAVRNNAGRAGPEKQRKPARPGYSAGQSPLEKLPIEILDQIIPMLAVDIPPNDYTSRNGDLVSLLLTSRTLYAVTIPTLYKTITIPHSSIFYKFLNHIMEHPSLGAIMRRLDFSHFNSVGLGRTRRDKTEIQMLTPTTLVKCLELAPHLHEFLVQEHLDDDLDTKVIEKVFCNMPHLRALDFCGASSASFKQAYSAVLQSSNPRLPMALSIQRLSLHECTTLPGYTFDALLPRLPRLTHLDVGHTQIASAALLSIPTSARLTHLNLSKCTRVSGERVVDFLTTHPAVKDSLVYLNLLADISRYRLLEQAEVDALLPLLPSTLRALNLSGAKISGAHVPMLLPLTKHLEELSLGQTDLSIDDINAFFVPKGVVGKGGALSNEEKAWVAPSLRYLDLTGIATITPAKLLSTSCVLLQPMTKPLEVLEVGENVISGLRERVTTSRRLGWVVRELGRRSWYVREPVKDAPMSERDSGKRAWKMGATWWGMRKIPVAWGEVGGLYGHYMFKK